jgi:hypothetical protein
VASGEQFGVIDRMAGRLVIGLGIGDRFSIGDIVRGDLRLGEPAAEAAGGRGRTGRGVGS